MSDAKYKQIYMANGLQPGFIAHADYVGFVAEFGRQTEAFLRETRVIK